jgi:hypothetical protein
MLPSLGVVGCGQMGSALAQLFAAAGFPLLLTSRTQRSASVLARRIPRAIVGALEWVVYEADVVVLATPIEATCVEIAPRVRELVVGKPVIDVSNPGFLASGDEVSTAVSAAEQIAGALPGSHIVKALNCFAARRIADIRAGAVEVTIPIAGDDILAKCQVSSILERIGFEVADAGPLSSSRWIESLTQLLLRVGTHADAGDAVGFRLVRLTEADRTSIAGR